MVRIIHLYLSKSLSQFSYNKSEIHHFEGFGCSSVKENTYIEFLCDIKNDNTFFLIINEYLHLDLSNDSYGTVVNMGLDGEGASPGGGGNGAGGGPPRGYLGATTPPYLSTSRSPSLPPQFPYPPDAGLSVYTTLGK